MTDQSSPVLRRRSLRPFLLASGMVTAVGLLTHFGALVWNSVPLPEGTGANIGAGLLALAGLVVAGCGLVMLVVGGVLVRGDSRR